MPSNQIIPAVPANEAASVGWMFWLIQTAGSSAVSTATTAATDTFLRTLVNPTITTTAVLTGYAASMAFYVTTNVAWWGVSTVASGATTLWNRMTQPAPVFQGNKDGNLGFY